MTSKHTDLGTNEIHQRHSVMVEGGKMPRAKVMDQTIIDRYLIDGLLSLSEHQAGEYLLHQASRAGIFAKPLRYEVGGGEPSKDAMATELLMKFGRTLALVRKTLGIHHHKILQSVVLEDRDISSDSSDLKMLKQALRLIADRRMAGGRNPLRHLKSRS